HAHAHNAGEAAYAVVLVYNQVADGEVGVRAYPLGVGDLPLCARAPAAAQAAARYLRIREYGEAQARIFYPRGKRARGYDAAARRRQGAEALRKRTFYAVTVQKLRQQPGPAHV